MGGDSMRGPERQFTKGRGSVHGHEDRTPISSHAFRRLPPSSDPADGATPGAATAARRPSRRSPTSFWMIQITTSISTISTELYAIATP